MAEHVSDAILLERFVAGREEAAFVALVQRHGPLVEAICRRTLHNEHDVEDVFQATFVVLWRKAAGIPWRDSVGGWLGAVAHRLALHTRADGLRHQLRETPMTVLEAGAPADRDGRLARDFHSPADPVAEVEHRDLRRVIDHELLQLPEKYRAPVVLCYLEGRTHAEAARQLGWPTGSISRRLEKATSLLRRRLVDRGLTLAVIGLVTVVLVQVAIRTTPSRSDRSLVAARQAMAPFKPQSEGGRGLEAILAGLARPGQSSTEADRVIPLAHEAARVAIEIEGLDPGENPGAWRTYAAEMRLSALLLAEAKAKDDPLALLGAARRLESSCWKCHDAFHQ